MTAPAMPSGPPNPEALLSHLTSRPSVLSTLILSRKNGSIIRCTGQLATEAPAPSPDYAPSAALEPPSTPSKPASTTSKASEDTPQAANAATTTSTSTSAPTPAQTLARHIFTYVSTATALAASVHALDDDEADAWNAPSSLSRRLAASKLSGSMDGSAETAPTGTTGGVGQSAEEAEIDEEREVKLLRLRTKGREVVVVVEKEWLLVVVNDIKGGGEKVS